MLYRTGPVPFVHTCMCPINRGVIASGWACPPGQALSPEGHAHQKVIIPALHTYTHYGAVESSKGRQRNMCARARLINM